MSANATTAAPTGRKRIAQGKERSDAALGNDSPNSSSPEGATQESAKSLLKILLAKRETGFKGRGKYRPPTAPDLEGLPEPPNGWIWASPEQLANAAPYSLGIGPFGSNLKVSDYRETGTPLIFVRNIRAEDFSLVAKFVAEQKANELAAHTAEGGDILITKMGEPPGDAAFYPVSAPKAVITADCIKWRLADDLRVPKFFVYAIRSRLVQQQIQNRTRGVAQKKISLERFRDLAIPLPPLPEQRRIVAEIEKQFTRLEAGVAALRRVQANLKRYRAAVLKAACEGHLVPTEAELTAKNAKSTKTKPASLSASFALSAVKNPAYETGAELLARIRTERRQNWQGRGQYKEPAAPDTSSLPEIPDNWTWATVEQLAAPEPNSITDGPFGSNLKTEHYMVSGPRVIRLQNIGDGVYVDEEAHITQAHFERLQKHRIFAGDVVIAGFGENPPRSCIIPESLGPAIVKADCIRFKPHSSVLPKYMNVALNSDPVRKRTKGMVHGVGRPRLNLGEIKSIVLPLPPLAEQTRIVAEVERRLSVVEELESVVTANLQRATRLRQSILQKAFTGEL